MNVIPDGRYGVGVLEQWCDACRWRQKGHRIELLACPACGASLPDVQRLAFGGLYIEHVIKRGYCLHSGADMVRVQELDVPDVVHFMARHWNTPRYGDLGGSARVAVIDAGDPARRRSVPPG